MTDFSAHRIAPGDADYVEKYNALLDELNASVNAIKGQIGSTKVYEPDVHLFTENQAVKRAVGELSVERATDATYFDKYGVLRTAAIDEIRLNEKGVLIEDESENLLVSAIPDESSWASTRCILASNSTKAPDGTQTASKLIVDDITTPPYIFQGYSSQYEYISGEHYTAAYFVKAGTASIARVTLHSNAFSEASLTIDLVTGAVAAQDGVVSYKVIELHDGWFLLTLTALSISSTSTYAPLLYVFNGDVGDYLYVWHAQLEKSSILTSPIDGGGTRIYDNINLPALNNIPASTQPQSIAVYVEKYGFYDYEAVWAVGNITDDYRMFFNLYLEQPFVQVTIGGEFISYPLGYVTEFKGLLIVTFDGVEASFYVNDVKVGSKIVSKTNSNVLDNPISFGHQAGTIRAKSIHLKDFRIWDGYVLSESDRALLLAEYS